jgi:polyisoprenoid-binding protein YceI
VDTRGPEREAHLRSADFFDVEKYPTLEFQSRSVTPTGDSRWDVQGDLTIRGVTKPVTLDVQFHGVIFRDPWGGQRAGFSATATVDREDYGLLWNQALETGGVVLGKEIWLELEVEAIRS